MEEITPGSLIAVFEEMFGRGLFWTMVAAAAAVTLAWLLVLIRDRKVSWRKFPLAQLSMPLSAVVAVWFVLTMTSSSLRHVGGPVDVIVLLAVAGAVGMAIPVYVLQSLIRRPRADAGD